jgi:hypothetical protein
MSGGPTGQAWADPGRCSHPAEDVIENNIIPNRGWCTGCGDPVRRTATRTAPGLGQIVEWVLVNPPENSSGTGTGPGTSLPPPPPPRAS